MSLDRVVRVGDVYLDEFNTKFVVTKLANTVSHNDCEVWAKELQEVGDVKEPVRFYGTEAEFRAQFDPVDPVPLPESKYTFSGLDSYSLEDLHGIRKKLRDELTTEIHKRDAIKAEILFLCTEITKYKKGD